MPAIIPKQTNVLSINPFTRIVTDKKGKSIPLTAKEFDLLYFLVSHKGQVFSKEQLYNNVWGYDYPGDARTVDVHIRRLREKIEINPSEPKFVHTKWGVGYYFQG